MIIAVLSLTVCAQAFLLGSQVQTTTTRRFAKPSDLSPFEYYVIRLKGTEPAWTSPLNDEKRTGSYSCKACGAVLFDSSTKFDSGTGWPSFFDALSTVKKQRDISWPVLGLTVALTVIPALLEGRWPSISAVVVSFLLLAVAGFREEVVCGECGGHLGHVFPDGPRPTGQRYCCNGASLSFTSKDET